MIRTTILYLECGGKRSATPLWIGLVEIPSSPDPKLMLAVFTYSALYTVDDFGSGGRVVNRVAYPKRRRRFALPAHSKYRLVVLTSLIRAVESNP